MKKEATIYDIAKELNLSASTVSRALKNNKVINVNTRERVMQCAENMGYRSNAFASNLRTQRTHTIGIIVPRLDSNFMSACLAGMEEVANEKGYNVIISQSHESVKKEEQNTTTMFNNRVDGLIASLTVEDSDLHYFERFYKKNVPVVFFDRIPTDTCKMCFVIDNVKLAMQATQHLIDQQCNNIAHVTIKSNSNVYRDRIAGFEKALSKCSNCTGEVLYIENLSLDSGRKIARELVKNKKDFDGVFVANDMAAAGCIIELQKLGLNVPHDVAVVGFNNDPVATIVSPALTSVNYPGKQAGILAAQKLIAILDENDNSQQPNKVILGGELIVRESSLKNANTK